MVDIKLAERKINQLNLIPKKEFISLESNEKQQPVSALGRVLAEDIKADRDYPPYHRICMDGIAINYKFLKKRKWVIRGMVRAGLARLALIHRDSALEVNTGGVLPKNCDLIIPYEHLEIVKEKIKDGSDFKWVNMARLNGNYKYETLTNVHIKGSDIKKGQVVLKKSTIIANRHISLLASLGKNKVRVFKNPKITILQTGDELKNISEKVKPHQIRISNLIQLKSQLATHSFDVLESVKVKDNPEEIKKAFKRALNNFEVIIIIGGISKGKLDLVKKTLLFLKVKEIFHRVSQRPGKPFFLGKFSIKKKIIPIFALPGNPQSSLICLRRYLLPYLYKSFKTSLFPLKVKLTKDVHFNKFLTFFCLVKLEKDFSATPITTNGSGDFDSIASSDGFVELPIRNLKEEKKQVFYKGESYYFYSWEKML